MRFKWIVIIAVRELADPRAADASSRAILHGLNQRTSHRKLRSNPQHERWCLRCAVRQFPDGRYCDSEWGLLPEHRVWTVSISLVSEMDRAAYFRMLEWQLRCDNFCGDVKWSALYGQERQHLLCFKLRERQCRRFFFGAMGNHESLCSEHGVRRHLLRGKRRGYWRQPGLGRMGSLKSSAKLVRRRPKWFPKSYHHVSGGYGNNRNA